MPASPRIARWVLENLGCSADNDAVIGDLEERYLQGRSAAWYWQQALTAIAVSAFHEVRTHRMLTFRALISGSLFFWIAMYPLAAHALLSFGDALLPDGWRAGFDFTPTWAILPVISVGATFIAGFITGSIVKAVSGGHRSSVLLVAAAIAATWPVIFAPDGRPSLMFLLILASIETGILAGGLFLTNLESFDLVVVRNLLVGWGILHGAMVVGLYLLNQATRRDSFEGLLQTPVAPLLMMACGWISGSAVARLPQPQRPMLSLYLKTLLLFWLLYGAIGNSFGASLYAQAYFWMSVVLQLFGIWIGGRIRPSPRNSPA